MQKGIIRSGIFLIVTCLIGCYPTTRITGSWKSPQLSRNYHHVFVAALTGNTIARSTLEKEMSEALQKNGLQVTKSMDAFPPGLQKDSVTREALLQEVQGRKIEAILTISLQKKETESRYVSGAYAPMTRWDYYNNFWGYYNYWWPYAYSPGYYESQDIYYLETNLYDAGTEALLWSAQSRTYSYDGLAAISREFAITVCDRMRAEGVLK